MKDSVSTTLSNEYIFSITDINVSLENLRLFDKSLDISSKLNVIFDVFKLDPDLPGIILTDNGKYVDVIFRTRFFELMSLSFMLELFNNKQILRFYKDYPTDNKLVLPSYTLIVKAVELILQRDKLYVNEPVVVECGDGTIKIVDVYQVLLVHNHIHMLTVEQLKEVNSFKDEVLHIAAHDIKNPIQGIMGFTTIIEEDGNLDNSMMRCAGLIKKSASHILEIISDLLNSAVTQIHKHSLNISDFNICEVLNEVILHEQKVAERKNQIIRFRDFIEGICFLEGDKLKITEVIENLLSNAIKYSKFNAEIEVTSEIVGRNYNIIIADRGPGFTERDKKNIFGKFQRLSATPTGGEASTGLGLYIVKTIIDLHNGQILLENRPGGGSIFTIELPIKNLSKRIL